VSGAAIEQIFTSQFWHDQWDVIARAPYLIVPLLLIAGFVGWKWKGTNDDGEMRGLRAEVKGVVNVAAQRLELANEKIEAADEKYKAVVNRENELKDKVARQEKVIAELEKDEKKASEWPQSPLSPARFVQLSTSNTEIKSALTNLSTSTTSLGQALTALHALSDPTPAGLWSEYLTKRKDSEPNK
jgi:hypothetical protein